MNSTQTNKKLEENQKRIVALYASIALLMNTPNAKLPVVQAKVRELEDRLMFRLRELEVQGQDVKIEIMQEVANTIRNGV